MNTELRTLIIEDSESDAELVLYYLQRAGYALNHLRVDSAQAVRTALEQHTWDIILCDYNLPQFNAVKALEIVKEFELDVPFIVVSGAIGEETAVDIMKAGAHDVVMKANLKRLIPVLNRELAEAKLRRNHKRSEQLQRILFNIANAVITTSDLPSLVKTIQVQLSTIIDTTNFYIAIYNKSDDSFSVPLMTDETEQRTAIPAYKTLTGYVLNTRAPLMATRPEIDQLEADNLIQTLGEKAQVWLGVPLISGDEAIGVIVVQSYNNKEAYTFQDLEVLSFISDQVVLAIDRKRYEEQLRTSLAHAEESDRLKTYFLSNISHEINTPIFAISGYSDLLNDESISIEEKHEYLSIINASCRDLVEVFQKLVDIAKLDSQQMTCSLSPVNLLSLFEEIQHQFGIKRTLVGKDHLAFSIHHPSGGNIPNLKTDLEKLKKILRHLLDNALKFTDQGSIDVGYEVKENYIEFFVRDSGIGIPEEMNTVIFERFRQVEENFARTYSGSGLGLPVSKGMIQLLGGNIWVKSIVGEGTSFYFTIPYQQ